MQIGKDYIGVTTTFYCHDGEGKILMHKRSQKCRDEQGMWDSGGGKLEFGLTPEENVLREVMEEYGCRGVIEEQLPIYNIFRENGGHKTHWLAVPFIIKVDPLEVRLGEPEKMDEIGWFKLSNLPEPLHSGFKRGIERYASTFAKYRMI